MAGVRIRWRGVARVAAIIVVGLFVLRLLPGFLRAPEPPPLAADVGLPKATPVTEAPRGRAAKPATDVPERRAADRPRKERRRSRPRAVRDAPASTAVIGSKKNHSHPKKVVESAPPPVPEYLPPSVPEAVPEPLPQPPPAPPSTPGDGSQEFAPH